MTKTKFKTLAPKTKTKTKALALKTKTKVDAKTHTAQASIYALLCILQDGGGRHLEFPKHAILYPLSPLHCPYLLAHQLWCKLVKNQPSTLFSVFSKMAAANILDLLFLLFGPHTMSLLLDSVSCQWRKDQPEFVRDIAILPFHDFGWKFLPILFLGDFDPLHLWRHHFNPQKNAVPAETRIFDILRVKIDSAVSPVGLSK